MLVFVHFSPYDSIYVTPNVRDDIDNLRKDINHIYTGVGGRAKITTITMTTIIDYHLKHVSCNITEILTEI